ncbi:protein phosphatase 2C domain-containing protein [Rathayibacter sp. YIM 133350]|uniref:PP2C family protein-serine/threonine phosphatase n=1 Tax=Rathayibacter sp. YIM 133350 TaxID=3131992 RepID=UPI00307EEECF
MTQIGQGNAQHTTVLTGESEASVTLAWSALTDTGHRREANEDSYMAQSPIFAVADGMGGHSAGDFASAAVVTRLAEHGTREWVDPAGLEQSLRLAVDDMGRGGGVTDAGTGTTVTGVALTRTREGVAWLVFNIGDSRVYLLSHGVLEQLTTDHSIVQELVDAGHISREEAETHPHSNVITRAVGFHEVPIPDYRLIAVEEGTRLLICSDGLTKELTPYGIRHFLMSTETAEDATRQLVDAALGNGGRDNVTAIVVDVLGVTGAAPEPHQH